MDLLNKIKKAGSGETFVKALLTGPSGAGKTTSIVFGAPKPLLMIDMEDGHDQYAKAVDFDIFESTDPKEILEFTNQLLALQATGHQIPYKSIAVDSGTVLYKKIKKWWVKELAGDGTKRKLEPNEYDLPKDEFYEIIGNLKALKVNLFVTAHAADNYMKGSFMQIDPNEPIKADCEKRLIHEMDVHIMMKQTGKRWKADIKKSRLMDKQGNNLLPAAIDNFDNKTIISMIVEMAQKDKGFESEKPAIQNVIQTDRELSNMIEEIVDIANNYLQLPMDQAVQIIQQGTNGQVNNPYQLNKEQASAILNYMRQLKVQAQNNANMGVQGEA